MAVARVTSPPPPRARGRPERSGAGGGALGDAVGRRVEDELEREELRPAARERVAQMLDHFTQYVGSSPYGSPAVLCGIAHMQTQEGIWYPRGGTAAIPAALAKLADQLGVEIRDDRLLGLWALRRERR